MHRMFATVCSKNVIVLWRSLEDEQWCRDVQREVEMKDVGCTMAERIELSRICLKVQL